MFYYHATLRKLTFVEDIPITRYIQTMQKHKSVLILTYIHIYLIRKTICTSNRLCVNNYILQTLYVHKANIPPQIAFVHKLQHKVCSV